MHSSCTACSLPFDRSKSTDFHRSCIVCYPVQYFRCCLESTYSSTAHHALIDVPDIYFGNILAQYAKPFGFHKPPLASYSGISRTPSIFSRALPQIICFSGASLLLLPPSHCTVLHSASDTVWYTEKPGFSIPHVFIYRVRSSGWLINIWHSPVCRTTDRL